MAIANSIRISVVSAVLYNCSNRQLETKGVIQTVSLSIQSMNTLTCQWGLKSDVIMVTSLIRTLRSVPSVSVLERFDCVTHFGFAHSFCATDNSINIIIIILFATYEGISPIYFK